MGVSVKVYGVQKAISNLEKYVASKHLALLGTMIEGSKNIANDAKRMAPVDLGKLRNNITYTVKDRKNLIEGNVISGEKYSGFVEYGTSPHFPPPSALEGWAMRHGFGPGGGYLVARKISQRGTPPQPFMYPSYKLNKDKIVRSVVRVLSTP